jgi:hypothetical protein
VVDFINSRPDYPAMDGAGGSRDNQTTAIERQRKRRGFINAHLFKNGLSITSAKLFPCLVNVWS